jgi:PRTRC genetic system ThiF family protein
MITTSISSSTLLNSDYLNARKVILPQFESITLALVGCGGTGSWLAPSVVRVARLLSEKFGKRVHVFFVDPDKVEQKNCYRQNFCEAEVGRFKADSLAYRYGLAWGVEVIALSDRFKNIHHSELMQTASRLIIGCVDGPAGRKEIFDGVLHNSGAWWLDCGNHKSAGQVLLGCGGSSPDPFSLPGFCSWLPLPSTQHPELLELIPEIEREGENLSCADLALLDSQGLSINQRIASEAADFLVRMLITRDLERMATYIDLASGSSRSVYITKEIVEEQCPTK